MTVFPQANARGVGRSGLPPVSAPTGPYPVYVRVGAALTPGQALAERKYRGVRQLLVSTDGHLAWVSVTHIVGDPAAAIAIPSG